MADDLRRALENAIDNPQLEKPAQDDETSQLSILFENLCKFMNLAPKDALEILGQREWGDDSDFSSAIAHIRPGF